MLVNIISINLINLFVTLILIQFRTYYDRLCSARLNMYCTVRNASFTCE